MAAYRIGMRVRIVVPDGCYGKEFDGVETVITGPLSSELFGAQWRTAATDGHSFFCGVREYCLIPLTDPSADAFLARIKKLGSEPVNAVEKEGVK